LIAQPTLDVGANARVAFVVVEYPRSEAKRRVVADVLAVPARQLSHPGTGLILTKGDDRPVHEPDLTPRQSAPPTASWLAAIHVALVAPPRGGP